MNRKQEAPYQEFGRRLMDLRTEAGMTRQQLGELCGVAPSTIVNYERGLRVPYADTAMRMAKAFGLTTEELLGDAEVRSNAKHAELLEAMRMINGAKGEARLRYHLNAASSALAGGDLNEEQVEEFALEMTKMAMMAQQKLREMHTGKQYAAAVEEKGAKTQEMIRALDETIAGLSETSAQKETAENNYGDSKGDINVIAARVEG